MLITQLLTPETFAKLSPDALARLIQVIEAEIVANPEVRKQVQAKADQIVPHLLSTGP